MGVWEAIGLWVLHYCPVKHQPCQGAESVSYKSNNQVTTKTENKHRVFLEHKPWLISQGNFSILSLQEEPWSTLEFAQTPSQESSITHRIKTNLLFIINISPYFTWHSWFTNTGRMGSVPKAPKTINSTFYSCLTHYFLSVVVLKIPCLVCYVCTKLDCQKHEILIRSWFFFWCYSLQKAEVFCSY